ncbi:hypothetical protein OCF84_20900 (plasmid) [Shewanella xiamenensis]|uniref:Uncharacterized protein n=1 Tax=Shewanella xiamenensis TaxID=332186 RepID=A0ABT6UFM8_9GAMM|nr:hypothetical protein [Shewanella xiamenensis]MDI5833272.1 hypothetical protein [Shewanella xiamenensis]WHF57978.1 hypothetical protein OCF84_20900 [Shewanella xiamenensis]
MSDDKNFLSIETASERLGPYISSDYKWPSLPTCGNWQLKFIVYQDGGLVMDFLDVDTGSWWSENNEILEIPYNVEGAEITVKILIEAGIPYMC